MESPSVRRPSSHWYLAGFALFVLVLVADVVELSVGLSAPVLGLLAVGAVTILWAAWAYNRSLQ